MNNFILQLVAGLNKTKSKQQIKSDAKSLGDMKFVKLIGNLDMPKIRKAIKAQLKGLNNLTFNITPNVNTKGVQSATKQAINNAQRVANSNKVHLNFDTSKQQLVNQIKILGRNNNKLFNDREMTAKYNQLLNAANVAKSTGELKTLRGELSAFKTELVATNNAGMTWGSKFKESVKSYTKFFSGASLVYAISNQVRNAATEAKTLDDSLVNLQKVTDEISDRDTLYKYFDKSLSKAQELNVKVGSLIDAVTEFKKLGWDLDDAELGAKWANILSNVGDVDIDTAIGSIKTSIASFDEIGGYGNDQMGKKLEAYTDLINNMSNKYSIDAEGLAESIRLSAGTLTEAHMSIEQAATMFATANKYYNDPSYLGNTTKIGSLRMRASSGDTDAIEELQEMGEEVDDLATATSNLREKLMALTGVDIMEDEHTFKSYYDQLYEISQVMDKLDDTSRANVLETMFGKSRSAAGAAILSGMKESASAYEDAINSAGSATEEYQTWMTSADAACQRFSNTLTETYQGIINGNTVRDLANLGSAVLELANKWGIVEGTLKGVIALNLGKFIATGGMALITATKQVEQYGKALQMASNVPNGNLSARFQALKSIAQATSTLTTEQLRNVLATNTLTQADRVRILQMQGMTKEMALQKLAEMNLTQVTNAQTAANTASTVSTFSLKAAMTGLGRTIQSVFLSNPVGIVLMGVSLGVSAVTSAISKHNQSLEETRQKTKEAAEDANTLSNEISELANKYIQLSEAVKTDSASKEDLMSVQEELIKKLGIEGQSVDDLIAKYGSLDNALKNITLQELGDQENDLIAGVKAAEEELKDIGKGYEHLYSSTDRNLLSSGGDDAVKAYEVLEKANLISKGSYGTGGGAFVLTGDDETVEGILENYQKLEDAMTALRESGQFTETELTKNPVFSQIYDRAKEMEEFVNGYNDAISNLNKNVAEQQTITLLQGNEIPKTEKEFETFRQELIDTSIASKKFIGNEKEITDAINNYLSTVPQFQGFYSVPLENELDKVDELLNEPSVLSTDELKEKISDLNSAIDSIQSAYDTLTSACEEYNSNGGQLSIDTIQSLMGLSSEYLACLQEENGQLSINQEAIVALANAKLDEAQALAIEQAMTELDTISKGENTSATADYVSGNAALMESLQILAGKYDNVASSAMTAAQAQALSSGISAASAVDPEATKATMAALDKKLEMISKARNQISSGNLAGLKKSSSSGSSSKSSKDELKEAFQAEYDLLKHNLDMEYITEEQYYNGVQALNEKYFAGKEEYLDDYRKYEEEVYKGLKSYYKSYCDDMMDYYDKKLDASKMSYKEYCDSVSKMLADMHNSGKISDKDWYDYTKTMLEKQKDAYDRALSAITRRLQKEIDAWQAKIDALNDQNDALNDQKNQMDSAIDAITKVYDTEIDRIQGIIDGLKEANDERERTLALEQAKYELEKAYSQRVKKIYTEGKGYIYEVDYDAIKDAKKSYDNAELDVKTDELQKQIDTLEEFKKKWQDVQNAYQENIDNMNATALLGSEYQKLVLNNNILDIENFKTKYLKIQSQINDNEQLIKSYEEKVEYYTKLKEQWQSLSDEYSNSVDDMYAKMLLGQSWEADVLNGRLSTLNDFRNQYNDIQKSISDMAWQSANAQISALNAVKAAEATKAQTSGGSNGYSGSSGTTTSVGGNTSGGSGLTAAQKYQVRLAGTVKVIYEGSSETDLRNWITRNNYIGVSRTIQNNIIIYFAKKKEKKYIGQVYKTSGQASSQVGMLGGVGYDKVSGGYQVYKYAKGTNNAKPGIARVSEKEYGDEILIKNDNTATLVRGEQLVNFEGGEKVIPANETKEILKNQGNVEQLSDSDVITRKDGSILKPIHYEYENILTNFIKDNPDYMYSMNNISDNLCKDLFKNTENVNYDNRNVDNRVSIGEIHLHEVQNVDQFARELDRQLAGIVDQKLSRRKR
ncbi:phage tail tape measure protein [Roseburia inulinivorans]